MATASKAAARAKNLQAVIAAAEAEARTAREAAADLAARVAAGQEVTAEEWRDLPAAASLADAKLDAVRAEHQRALAELERERATTFVKASRARLCRVPDAESRLREAAVQVKAILDEVEAEIEAYNATFNEIHRESRVKGTTSNSLYGATTQPLLRELGLYADKDSAGDIIRIDGEEFRSVGSYGLAEDVASYVVDLRDAEAPAPAPYYGLGTAGLVD